MNRRSEPHVVACPGCLRAIRHANRLAARNEALERAIDAYDFAVVCFVQRRGRREMRSAVARVRALMREAGLA